MQQVRHTVPPYSGCGVVAHTAVNHMLTVLELQSREFQWCIGDNPPFQHRIQPCARDWVRCAIGKRKCETVYVYTVLQLCHAHGSHKYTV